MKKWRKLFLALECVHLAILCAQQIKKLLKRKKKKKEDEEEK